MKRISLRKTALVFGLSSVVLTTAACDPNAVYTGGSVYYDSMLWNDYFYDPVRPPRPERPDRPVRPVHPIAPVPPRPTPPIARPPAARPPIHRPRPR